MSETVPRPGVDDELLGELNANMMQLGRLLMARHGEHDATHRMHHLSEPKYLALKMLGAHDTLRMSEIADVLGVKPPTASALVEDLVTSGHAERLSDPADRRAVRVGLTAEGRSALDLAEACRREMMRQYCSALSAEDVQAMVRITHKLIDAMSGQQL